jgi:hypothetical protein
MTLNDSEADARARPMIDIQLQHNTQNLHIRTETQLTHTAQYMEQSK